MPQSQICATHCQRVLSEVEMRLSQQKMSSWLGQMHYFQAQGRTGFNCEAKMVYTEMAYRQNVGDVVAEFKRPKKIATGLGFQMKRSFSDASNFSATGIGSEVKESPESSAVSEKVTQTVTEGWMLKRHAKMVHKLRQLKAKEDR